MLEKTKNPEDAELIEALSINLRVLKHSERNTYRGGELSSLPDSSEEVKREPFPGLSLDEDEYR